MIWSSNSGPCCSWDIGANINLRHSLYLEKCRNAGRLFFAEEKQGGKIEDIPIIIIRMI